MRSHFGLFASEPAEVLTPGNCSIYPKADAVTLLGGVNMNNKALDLQTDGGTKVDMCSYVNLSGLTGAVALSHRS